MHAPLRALAARLLGSWAATAAAGCALGVVAATVEGTPPDLQRLRRLLAGPTLAVAATWSLSAWRREGADLALAALGHRPSRPVWATAGLAAILGGLAAAPAASEPRAARLDPGAATFRLEERPVTVVWRDGAAHLPGRPPWEALSAPAAPQAPPRPRPRPEPALAALAVLAAGLGPRLGPFAALALAGALSALAGLWTLGGAG